MEIPYEAFATARGLWKLVDRTKVLADNATEQVRTDFEQHQQKAFSMLVLAISTSQLFLVTSCEMPDAAWIALCRHFKCESLANKLFLKKKHFQTEMHEGSSMQDHLKYMMELTDHLVAVQAPVSKEDQVVTLLGSLPQSYATLVTALEA